MFADDTCLTATGESSFEIEYKLGGGGGGGESKTLRLG